MIVVEASFLTLLLASQVLLSIWEIRVTAISYSQTKSQGTAALCVCGYYSARFGTGMH